MNRFLIRPLLPLAALALVGCSNGLVALGDTSLLPTDTDPVDTDTDPVDTDTDSDTDIVSPNNPPTADAGDDQFSLTGAVIELDSTGSTDPDGDTLSFQWSMTSSPPGWAGSVINANRADAQFFADTPGTYAVELVVDDGEFSASDSVTITVDEPNEVPVANAGSDQYVDQGAVVQLNGSNSYDPDSDPLTYAWTLIDGPVGTSAALDDPSSPLPRFTADLAGVFSVELIVEDTAGNISAPDVVRITAQGDSGGGGGSDCFSCVAQNAQYRFSRGQAAAAPGFLLFFALPLMRRRRRRDRAH